MSDRNEPDEEERDKPNARPSQGSLDYPSVVDWLPGLEVDKIRGRDGHEYTKLLPVFDDNEIFRIDDISRMSPQTIKTLATEMGVTVSFGLISRVFHYAGDDVERVKNGGI